MGTCRSGFRKLEIEVEGEERVSSFKGENYDIKQAVASAFWLGSAKSEFNWRLK